MSRNNFNTTYEDDVLTLQTWLKPATVQEKFKQGFGVRELAQAVRSNLGQGKYDKLGIIINKDDFNSDAEIEQIVALCADNEEFYERGQPAAHERKLLPEVLFDPRNVPERKPALIQGILRRGHKLLLSAPSKAGKSFLTAQLALAVAEGREWLGIPCLRGTVVYANLEIDDADFMNRLLDIQRALRLDLKHPENLIILNLRGVDCCGGELIDGLLDTVNRHAASLLIIDPLYKLLDGDENSAGDMAALLRSFDPILKADCSVMIVHHFAKNGGRGRDQIDRASGSSVFARDPDALLTLTEQPLSETDRERLDIPSTDRAFRLEFSLRSFPFHRPIGLYFRYPVHVVDEELLTLTASKSSAAPPIDHQAIFDAAFVSAPDHRLSSLSESCGTSEKTIRRRLAQKKIRGYRVENGIVYIDQSG